MPRSSDVTIGFIIDGDATDGVRAIKLTDKELKRLNGTQKAATVTSKNYARATRNTVDQLGKYAAIAGGAALAATAAMVSTGREQIDTLAKTADKLAVSTEALQGMRHAAELSGVASNTMDTALQRVTRRLAEVAETGRGTAKPALDALNLSADELTKIPLDEAMGQIADRMDTIESPAQKVALAFKLFDTEGVNLVNTLRGGSAGLRAARQDLDAYGGAISRIDAAKVEIANDQMTRAGIVTGQLAQQVTVQLAPVISGLANEFLNTARESGGMAEMVGKAIDFSVRVVGVFADGLHGLNILWNLGKTAVLGWAKFVAFALEPVARGINELSNIVADFLGKDTVKFEDTVFGEIQRGIDDEFTSSVAELNKLLEKPLPSREIEKWTETVESKAQEAAEVVAESSADISASISEGVTAGTDKAETEFKKFGDNILGDFENISENLKRAAISLLQDLAVQFGSARLGLNLSANVAVGASGALASGAATAATSGIGSATAGGFLGSILPGYAGGTLANYAMSNGAAALGITRNTLIHPTLGEIPSVAGGVGGTGFNFNPLTAAGTLAGGVVGGFAGQSLGTALTGRTPGSSIGAGVGGTAGAILGAAGSIGGPIGALIGSAIGGLIDSIFGRKVKDPRFSIGPTTLPDRQSFARDDIHSVTSSQFGSLRFQSDKDMFAGASQQDADQLFQFFDLMAGLEDRIADQLDVGQVAGIKQELLRQEELYKKNSTDFTSFFVERFSTIFDEIGGEVGAAFDKLSQNLTPDEFVESIESIANAAFTLGDLKDALRNDFNVLEEYVTKQRTILDVYQDAIAASAELIESFDHSVEGINALAGALDTQRGVANEIALSFIVLKENILATFWSTRDYISESILSEEELYNQRRNRIADLMQQLSDFQATPLNGQIDPAEVASITSQIDDLTRAAWQSLSDDQRAAAAPEFLAQLTDMRRKAGSAANYGQYLVERQELATAEDAVTNLDTTDFDNSVDQFTTNVGNFGANMITAANHFNGSVHNFGGHGNAFGVTVSNFSNVNRNLNNAGANIDSAANNIFAAARNLANANPAVTVTVENTGGGSTLPQLPVVPWVIPLLGDSNSPIFDSPVQFPSLV